MKTLLVASLVSALVAMSYVPSANAEKMRECNTDTCKEYFKKYRTAAKRGHPLAMATLGQFYFHGYGTEKNEKMALKYLKKGSRGGYPSASFKAGYIYLTSEKFKDIDDSIDYLEKATKGDYKGSHFLLGMIHYDKKYGVQDFEKADEHLTKSYKAQYNQVPKAINFIKENNDLNEQNFPKLTAELNKEPLAKGDNGELIWPESTMEVITINSPPLQATFDRQLVTFRKAIKSTGTRFKGKTCTERLTCMQRADIADATDFNFLFLQGFSGADVSGN